MLDIQRVILDLFTPALAVGIGLFYFKRLNRFNKLLFFQTLIYLVVDGVVVMQQDNESVYNILITIEMGLILLAVGSLFDSKKMRNILQGSYLMFLTVLMVDIILRGFFVFVRDASIVQGLLLTFILLYVLYTEFMGEKRWSIIFACIGMVLYFACYVPCLSIMFYLQELNPELNQKLFQYLVVLPQVIRYFFVAGAFAWQVYEERKQKEIKPI